MQISALQTFRYTTLVGTLLLLGCEGLISEQLDTAIPTDAQCRGDEAEHAAGPSEIRRLSPLEIDATLRDIFAELALSVTPEGVPLAAPVVRHHFSNTSETGHLNYGDAVLLMGWAESVSLLATENLNARLGCTATAAFDNCARSFTQKLGRLAFRRPLNPEEVAVFESVYTTTTEFAAPREGIRALWEMALQAPDFWYLSIDATEAANGQVIHTRAVASRRGMDAGDAPSPTDVVALSSGVARFIAARGH